MDNEFIKVFIIVFVELLCNHYNQNVHGLNCVENNHEYVSKSNNKNTIEWSNVGTM